MSGPAWRATKLSNERVAYEEIPIHAVNYHHFYFLSNLSNVSMREHGLFARRTERAGRNGRVQFED
jgi:hypothetical protein